MEEKEAAQLFAGSAKVCGGALVGDGDCGGWGGGKGGENGITIYVWAEECQDQRP